MKTLAAVAASFFMVFFAGTSNAAIEGHPTYQRWLNWSYMPMAEGTVTVDAMTWDDLYFACSGHVFGCYRVRTRTMSITWEDPGVKQTFFHELGHDFDRWKLNVSQRAWFARWFERPDQNWWQPPDVPDTYYHRQSGLEEWFADLYSICSRFKVRPDTWAIYHSFGERSWPNPKVKPGCNKIRRIGSRINYAVGTRPENPFSPRQPPVTPQVMRG